MEVSEHVKIKWLMRGGSNKSVNQGWANGIRVKLPNYKYGSARYDTDTSIALLSNGKGVTTAIKVYEHTEMLPLEQVDCSDCDSTFQGREDCPTCGSLSWRDS